MTREEKIKYMVDDLARRGVGKYTAAPPLHRFLWRIGWDVPPPLFASFWLNALLLSLFVAIASGGFIWLAVLRDEPALPAITVAASVRAACGLSLAAYFRWRSRKLGLPSWHDYPGSRVT